MRTTFKIGDKVYGRTGTCILYGILVNIDVSKATIDEWGGGIAVVKVLIRTCAPKCQIHSFFPCQEFYMPIDILLRCDKKTKLKLLEAALKA